MIVGDKVWLYTRGGKPKGPVEVCREKKAGWIQVVDIDNVVTSERIGNVYESEKEAWTQHLKYVTERRNMLISAVNRIQDKISKMT